MTAPTPIRPRKAKRRPLPADTISEEMSNDIIGVDEVAAWLRVNRTTVYAAAGRQEIPHRRLGKRILFSRTAVAAWIKCQ